MIISDFDGVFTDGSVYISEKNVLIKASFKIFEATLFRKFSKFASSFWLNLTLGSCKI